MGEIKAWLITGGKIYKDTVCISEDSADSRIRERKDSSIKVPLYSANSGHCTWYRQQGCDGWWGTECNKEIVFEEGNPKDSEYKYCTFCGKEIKFSK